MRRADADTFLAGDGRLVSKIYPFAVNYRSSAGSFAPIDPRLVRSGNGYVQAANNLGLRLPAVASGPVSVRNRGGAVAFSLAGARGEGAVVGSTERFAAAAPGVSLSYSSLNTGLQWGATLSRGALARGLRWFVARSAGCRSGCATAPWCFKTGPGRSCGL